MSVYFKSVMIVITTIIVIASATLAMFVALSHAHEYEITGHNALTGERVAGTMIDTAHNGTVHGLILDRLDRVPASGTWSGKGLARMRGDGQEYRMKVVE